MDQQYVLMDISNDGQRDFLEEFMSVTMHNVQTLQSSPVQLFDTKITTLIILFDDILWLSNCVRRSKGRRTISLPSLALLDIEYASKTDDGWEFESHDLDRIVRTEASDTWTYWFAMIVLNAAIIRNNKAAIRREFRKMIRSTDTNVSMNID